MKKILYIGGVGSDSHLVGAIARLLESQLDVNVIAMSFSEARRNGAAVARLAPECLVITHAAGMLLLKNTTPKELIAIAPPMPTVLSLLMWRTIPLVVALIASGRESVGRPRKVAEYLLRAIGEHLLHPYSNSLLLKEISMFNAAQLAVEMPRCGTKVTLGFMENDQLSPDAHLHPHMEIAREQGIAVYDTVLGHRDEFTLYPLEVLAQVGLSK
jgi:hypothetical protein